MKKEKQNGFVDHSRYDVLPDEEIVTRVLEGHIDLFEVILRRYNQKLYRIVRSYISEDDEIKDVLQNAYIRGYEHLHQFRAEAKFSTWLVRITINEALKHLNRQKRISSVEIGLNGNGHHPLVAKDDPEQQTIRSDMKRLLEHAIQELPPKYRNVFVMREIELMSTRETAACLDITRANVKVRLYRAKNQLRKELEKRVLDTEIFLFKGARCDFLVQVVMDRVYEKITATPELAVRNLT